MGLYQKVERILEQYPHCRNSDMKLTLNVWWANWPGAFVEVAGERFVSTKSLEDVLPTQDAIKRIRAHIQNTEGRLLPTDEKVKEHRRKFHKDGWSFEEENKKW